MTSHHLKEMFSLSAWNYPAAAFSTQSNLQLIWSFIYLEQSLLIKTFVLQMIHLINGIALGEYLIIWTLAIKSSHLINVAGQNLEGEKAPNLHITEQPNYNYISGYLDVLTNIIVRTGQCNWCDISLNYFW